MVFKGRQVPQLRSYGFPVEARCVGEVPALDFQRWTLSPGNSIFGLSPEGTAESSPGR
jgi:hypothetical protein